MCHAEYHSAKALMDSRLREASSTRRQPSPRGLEPAPTGGEPTSLHPVLLLLVTVGDRLATAWHTGGLSLARSALGLKKV
jgi:hypothetical protein